MAILLAALVALAAGCGGGGKKSSSSIPASTASSSTTETSGGGGGSTPSFASAKNCQDLAGLAAKATSAIGASAGNPAATLDAEANVLQGLANAAPSDIRGDFETMSSAFTSFVHALEKAGYKSGSTTAPSPTQLAALAKAARSFNTAKVRAAERHLSTWAKQNCKGVHIGG